MVLRYGPRGAMFFMSEESMYKAGALAHRAGIGCRVQGAGFRVQGSGFRVQGSGSHPRGERLREARGEREGRERSLYQYIYIDR